MLILLMTVALGADLVDARFDNGRRVVLYTATTLPAVTVATRVGAGGDSAPEGQDHLPHLVEHLWFRAPVVEGLTVVDELQGRGCVFNATTRDEDVRYISVCPNDTLESLVELEIRRAGSWTEGITPAVVDSESAVVASEEVVRASWLHQVGLPLLRQKALGEPVESPGTAAASVDQVRAWVDEHEAGSVIAIAGDFAASEVLDRFRAAWGPATLVPAEKVRAEGLAKLGKPPAAPEAGGTLVQRSERTSTATLLVGWPLPPMSQLGGRGMSALGSWATGVVGDVLAEEKEIRDWGCGVIRGEQPLLGCAIELPPRSDPAVWWEPVLDAFDKAVPKARSILATSVGGGAKRDTSWRSLLWYDPVASDGALAEELALGAALTDDPAFFLNWTSTSPSAGTLGKVAKGWVTRDRAVSIAVKPSLEPSADLVMDTRTIDVPYGALEDVWPTPDKADLTVKVFTTGDEQTVVHVHDPRAHHTWVALRRPGGFAESPAYFPSVGPTTIPFEATGGRRVIWEIGITDDRVITAGPNDELQGMVRTLQKLSPLPSYVYVNGDTILEQRPFDNRRTWFAWHRRALEPAWWLERILQERLRPGHPLTRWYERRRHMVDSKSEAEAWWNFVLVRAMPKTREWVVVSPLPASEVGEIVEASFSKEPLTTRYAPVALSLPKVARPSNRRLSFLIDEPGSDTTTLRLHCALSRANTSNGIHHAIVAEALRTMLFRELRQRHGVTYTPQVWTKRHANGLADLDISVTVRTPDALRVAQWMDAVLAASAHGVLDTDLSLAAPRAIRRERLDSTDPMYLLDRVFDDMALGAPPSSALRLADPKVATLAPAALRSPLAACSDTRVLGVMGEAAVLAPVFADGGLPLELQDIEAMRKAERD